MSKETLNQIRERSSNNYRDTRYITIQAVSDVSILLQEIDLLNIQLAASKKLSDDLDNQLINNHE